jgi:hypothetical protein
MLYLIWGLLNIGIFVYFLSVCFRAIKLVRQEIGLFAAIVFVIGFLSFCSQPKDQEKSANSMSSKIGTFTSEDSLNCNPSFSYRLRLESNLISEYDLIIDYQKDSTEENVPISAYTKTKGFTAGTEWKEESVIVNKNNDNNKFSYSVLGVVDWNFLGQTVYTQPKTFTGTISIDKNDR